MSNNSIFFTNEIGTAFLSERADIDSLRSNAGDYIFALYNIDVSSFDLHVVENSLDSINLVLPYYSLLDNADNIAVADSSLDDVSGGEIGITIALIVGGLGLLTAGAAATAAGVAATLGPEKGKIAGGGK